MASNRNRKETAMKPDYTCPHCHAHLLVNDHLILTALPDHGPGILLLMNPEAGNYETTYHPSCRVYNGQHFDFRCPVCHHELRSELHKNLVKVNFTDENGKHYELHFSSIAGQKCTYKIMGNDVSSFGTDASKCLDVMGLIEKS